MFPLTCVNPGGHLKATYMSAPSRGLETEGCAFKRVPETASWHCIGAQVKNGSYVVIWEACKRTHNQYEIVVDFSPIHGNTSTLAAALPALV